jgi:lysozyme family protein
MEARLTRAELVEKAIDDILVREAGFVDHPADRGGPTNLGITMKTLSTFRRRRVDLEDIRTLGPTEARAIYRSDLYLGRFALVGNDALFELLGDMAVHHGTDAAARYLQRAVGVKEDGMIGPVTRAALERADVGAVYRKVVASRARLFGKILRKDPKQSVFALGWMNRLAEFIERAA